jgi:tetratricopeptide (TPR) repeat protein
MRRIPGAIALALAALLAAWMLTSCGDEEPTAQPPVDDHFRKGNEFAQAGDFEMAIQEYTEALDQNPDHVSVLVNLGVAYYSTGQLEQAVAQYEKAIELAPEDADVYSNLAAAYVQLGQLDKALETYQKAVELNPDLAEAHFGLGAVHAMMRQNELAIQAFVRFQELDRGQDPEASSRAQEYLEQLRGE